METVLTEAKSEDVRHGKTEQIEVGRRVHGAVGGDDHTGGHVAMTTTQVDTLPTTPVSRIIV